MGSHPSRSTLVTSNHQELKMSSESVTVFSVALLLVSSVSASPRNKDLHQRNGDFDLTELMNKFLAEYDSGNGDEYEPHKEEVSFDPEPQYNQDHQPYHHQQQHHHQQQQYYEDHQHHQQQQYYQDKPQQPSYQGYPPNEPRRNQVYNRYKDESNKVNSANQDEQKSVAQTSNSAKASQQPSVPAKEQTETSEEEVDPKLRDFTLIISKLLFQLSQL